MMLSLNSELVEIGQFLIAGEKADNRVKQKWKQPTIQDKARKQAIPVLERI